MKQYKCGGCGNSKFEIYEGEDSNIITKCTICLSKSIITVQSGLSVRWYVDEHSKFGDGCMCTGWED